ncbi:MAG TPA: response regulator transcription factor [Acidiphilium sp.]|uniref:response regulator transcription factor n=1 Tax=unclassified Acidiphilium TaxID=2617493 RepID=UPI000BDC9CFF|nr:MULTISPECIES: response regulator transcription factor [unclassified Acidiphilium]OYV57714.1 MAG: DNA-binding response regulator [Acidiphilium sp. 20-67-58]HQT60016.1 response regulator transcription factor [Acidiphilium sp.]HQU11519.1 response regulator transcription factor [Acidiphilium sp.]
MILRSVHDRTDAMTQPSLAILLVEDDDLTANLVRAALGAEGHLVAVAGDGREGLLRAAAGHEGRAWDLLIVDRMLPGLDGLALVRTLRGAGLSMPALFLTALGGIDDRVEGLRAGGDDYLVKPFAAAELAARVAALARRGEMRPSGPVLRVEDLELDRLTRAVSRAGRRIDLKPREYEVLEYMMRHAGRVVTRTMLLEDVWNFHFDPRTSVVESHVSRLRAKLGAGAGRELLHTVRGAGYRIGDPA